MKKFLIHLLGGHTNKEVDEVVDFCEKAAVRLAIIDLKLFADQMNGLPADDWCKLMYAHICGTIERLETNKNEQ